jgi:hypothetical protein
VDGVQELNRLAEQSTSVLLVDGAAFSKLVAELDLWWVLVATLAIVVVAVILPRPEAPADPIATLIDICGDLGLSQAYCDALYGAQIERLERLRAADRDDPDRWLAGIERTEAAHALASELWALLDRATTSVDGSSGQLVREDARATDYFLAAAVWRALFYLGIMRDAGAVHRKHRMEKVAHAGVTARGAAEVAHYADLVTESWEIWPGDEPAKLSLLDLSEYRRRYDAQLAWWSLRAKSAAAQVTLLLEGVA